MNIMKIEQDECTMHHGNCFLGEYCDTDHSKPNVSEVLPCPKEIAVMGKVAREFPSDVMSVSDQLIAIHSGNISGYSRGHYDFKAMSWYNIHMALNKVLRNTHDETTIAMMRLIVRDVYGACVVASDAALDRKESNHPGAYRDLYCRVSYMCNEKATRELKWILVYPTVTEAIRLFAKYIISLASDTFGNIASVMVKKYGLNLTIHNANFH